MVARITKGKDVQGALRYNMNKVDQGHARILFGHKIFESPNADLPDMESCMESFRLYLEANKSTKDTAFHVSLNPDPKDNLTNAQLSSIAQEYMAKMGFGEQPYIIYTHEDIFRKHVHIVSVRVDENGKAISDSNERWRSMDILRELEQKYHLHSSIKGQTQNDFLEAQKIDYRQGENLKQQISSAVRLLTQQYKFGSLAELNALLNLYNVNLEERKGEVKGKSFRGIIYSAMNDNGESVGIPIKSSRIGQDVGHPVLETKIAQNMTDYICSAPLKAKTRNEVILAMHATRTRAEFTDRLKRKHIDVLFRENKAGRIYGVTFIDHNTKLVLNGSRLGKSYSANVFQGLFNNPLADRAALLPKLPVDPKLKSEALTPTARQEQQSATHSGPVHTDTSPEQPDVTQHSVEDAATVIIEALDILSIGLAEEPLQPEEWEEIQNNLMNKYKKKRKKRGISR